jgi:putative ABC transport system permease protein
VRAASDNGWEMVSPLYVATPELLDDVYGVNLETIDPDVTILTVHTRTASATDELRIADFAGPDRSQPEPVTGAMTLRPTYSSLPSSFITAAEIERRGWAGVASGQWLVELPAPVTDEQLADAREIAAGAGLEIEVRDAQRGLSALRTGAAALGVVLALAILAMTVGLLRSEAGGDLRTLVATGASSGTRRMLTAVTAGGLALLGALLGIGGAYLALAAGDIGGLGRLRRVPSAELSLLLLATPTIAAATGWVFAGREPAGLGSRASV